MLGLNGKDLSKSSPLGEVSPSALHQGEKLILVVRAKTAGTVISVNGTLRTPDGRFLLFSHLYTTLADGAAERSVIFKNLGEVISLGVNIKTGTVEFGECWCTVLKSVSVETLFPITFILAQGYATSTFGPTYPGTIQTDPYAGQGASFLATPVDPVAGANINYVIPNGLKVQITTIYCRLITDATAANRHVALRLTNGTNTFLESDSKTRQSASQTHLYTFGQFGEQISYNTTIQKTSSPSVVLEPGDEIDVLAYDKQAGDQFSKIAIQGKSWMLGGA